MTIKLEEAVRLLHSCAGIIWGPDADKFWSSDSSIELTGDPEHMFLSLHLDDLHTSYDFHEGDNQEVHIEGSSIFLIYRDGDETFEEQLTMVQYWTDWITTLNNK